MYIFVLPFSNKSRKNMNVDNYNTPALVYLMKTVTCAFLDGLWTTFLDYLIRLEKWEEELCLKFKKKFEFSEL